MLWVELWLRAVREPELRPVAAGLYERYRAWMAEVIEAGVDSGEFDADTDVERSPTSPWRCSTGPASGR